MDNSVLCAAFAPNGRTLAVGTGYKRGEDEKGRIYLLEASTGGERCRFEGHAGHIYSVAFSPDGLLLASGGADGAPLVWDVTGRIVGPHRDVKPLGDKELDACWADLAGGDAAKAWQAILALAARPEQAVLLLRQRLRPHPPLPPQRLAGLLADLDSDSFRAREQASKELAALGAIAGPALRQLHASAPSPEVQRRVEKLLGKSGQEGILSEELRCIRALEVLEYLATPEASKLLAALAEGEPVSPLTQGAKAALDRLSKRPGPTQP